MRELTADRVTLDLVNLSSLEDHEVVIQAGVFAEHELTSVRYDGLADSATYPGPLGPYSPPTLPRTTSEVAIDDRWLTVLLPPGTRITLGLGMKRYVHQATYAGPWGEET